MVRIKSFHDLRYSDILCRANDINGEIVKEHISDYDNYIENIQTGRDNV